jgi:hypothetical protein
MKYIGYWILGLVPDSPRSMMIVILTMLLVVDMYNCKVSWGSRATGVDGVIKYFLRSSKSSYASLVHWNLSCVFRSLKKGSPLMPGHEMNLLRSAMQPVNFCTSQRLSSGTILVIADTFTLLGSIPHHQII